MKGRPRRRALPGAGLGRALAVAALLAAGAAAAAPAGDVALEYRVKAAFLFNFARFVSWPPGKFAGPEAPIVLCVLGPDPFGAVLDDTVRGKAIEGRGILVQRAARPEPLRDCHVVYAGETDAAELARLLEPLAGAGALVVHESGQALPSAGARFLIEDGRVRFEINAAAVAREGLQLSARLLSLAQVVEQ